MKISILRELQSHKDVFEKVLVLLQQDIEKACRMAVETLQAGHKIMFCGNGGSAADAQHLAAELTGRFKKDRQALAGLALTTDTSALTAISNDYDFDVVFARQVEALAQNGDLLIGISTSGNSKNIIRAFDSARDRGCRTIGLCGRDGGHFHNRCDLNIVVPADTSARVQEMHILIGHIMCQMIDDHCSVD